MNDNLRSFVRGAYQIQKLRIQMGNRIVSNFKVKLGQKPSENEDELDEDAKEILKLLRKQHKKIIDGIKVFPSINKFKGDEIISSYTELCLLDQYMVLEKNENQHFRRLEKVLSEYPIYSQFLEHIKGVGPAMAGVIISEFDIHKAKYSSSLWAYAGLDVAPDGQGRSRRKEHLVEQTYKDKNGEIGLKMGITFNPFLKTKLLGVLGSSFLRAGSEDNRYKDIYDNYKHRLEHRAGAIPVSLHGKTEGESLTKLHRHRMAIRYMIKMFLIDLYVNWRTIEGLPVHIPYHEAKLGLKHKVA